MPLILNLRKTQTFTLWKYRVIFFYQGLYRRFLSLISILHLKNSIWFLASELQQSQSFKKFWFWSTSKCEPTLLCNYRLDFLHQASRSGSIVIELWRSLRTELVLTSCQNFQTHISSAFLVSFLHQGATWYPSSWGGLFVSKNHEKFLYVEIGVVIDQKWQNCFSYWVISILQLVLLENYRFEFLYQDLNWPWYIF